MTPTRGDVYWIDLRDTADVSEWGLRPCVVISSDFFNRALDTLIVIPLTGRIERALDAGCVAILQADVEGAPGLHADSVALCHSPLTVPKHVLGDYIGRLQARPLSDIEVTVSFALALGPAR